MEMNISYTEETLPNGVRLIKLSGMFASSVAADREEELRTLIAGQGGTVLLDLSALEYLSSGGVRIITLCAKELQEAGGALHIAAPQPRVMAVLSVVGYVPEFPIYTTLDDAYDALLGD